MSKNQFVTLMLACLFFATSCLKRTDEDSVLTISNEKIEFAQVASKKGILVTTSQSEWVATEETDWISLSQNENRLNIHVMANDRQEIRKAYVTITAGKLVKKIEVIQEALGVTFVTNPTKLNINNKAGKYTIAVTSNTKEWTVTSDAEWAKATSDLSKNEIGVEVTENTGDGVRIAQLSLAGNDNKKQTFFLIKQEGKVDYLLPFLEWGKDLADFHDFEIARKSVQKRKPVRGNRMFDQKDYPYYSYETTSQSFPIVVYETLDFGETFMFTATVAAANDQVLDDDRFRMFLKNNNYEFESQKDDTEIFIEYYVNKEKKVRITVVRNTVKGAGEAQFEPIVIQEEDYPTFESLDFGLQQFGTAKKENIQAYENGNKGAFNHELTQKNLLIYNAPNPRVYRGYFLDENGLLVETMHTFSDINLGLYNFGSLIYLTKEFEALLKKEGFEFLGYNLLSRKYFYDHKKKQLRLVINLMNFGGKKMLAYNFLKLKPTGGN